MSNAKRKEEVLKSFVQYCETYPELRFWQALKNWSEYSFILAVPSNQSNIPTMIDTYSFEGRRGDKL